MAAQAIGLQQAALTVSHSNSVSKVPRIAAGVLSCGRLVRSRCSTSSPSSSAASQASAPGAATGASSKQAERNAPKKSSKDEQENRVEMISTIEEFDKTLRDAKDKLVVIEYAESHSVNSKRIYPAMVELSRTCPEVVFRLILADESEDTREIFKRAGVEKVPHFIFYKSMEVVHEEQGITEDMLLGDVLYYGNSGSSSFIEQLHSRAEVEAAIARHGADGQLLVLDVGLKHCGPCVKVYPTVIKLARRLAGSVAFARMLGDENEDCMAMLKEMDVIEVPTFLFIRDGEVKGRYVGSGKGELVGEILRHQGVKVT